MRVGCIYLLHEIDELLYVPFGIRKRFNADCHGAVGFCATPRKRKSCMLFCRNPIIKCETAPIICNIISRRCAGGTAGQGARDGNTRTTRARECAQTGYRYRRHRGKAANGSTDQFDRHGRHNYRSDRNHGRQWTEQQCIRQDRRFRWYCLGHDLQRNERSLSSHGV